MHNCDILQEKLGAQGQARGLGGGSRCPNTLELHAMIRRAELSQFKTKPHSPITDVLLQAIDDWVFKTHSLWHYC
jgi:hypothetical protein